MQRVEIVIVGCGRVGASLARGFDATGAAVTVVDINPTAFGRLGEDFGGEMVVGTGVDEGTLRRAGIERADAFAALTNGDNRNIMAAQVAKVIFDVDRVICRIYDPIRASIYRELGMETICSTTITSGLIRDFWITGENRAPGLEAPVDQGSREAAR